MKLKPEFVATVKAAIAQNPKSMAEAARLAKMHFGTFKRYAQELGLYETNMAGKGVSKPAKDLIPLDEILAGLHPTYVTSRLKKRILEAGLFEDRCYACPTTSDWYGKKLVMQLDHVNGDSTDHRLCNLKLLCPNCHSQTETYSGKNASRYEKKNLSEQDYLNALTATGTIHGAIRVLGLTVSKFYYAKCADVLERHPEISIRFKPNPKKSAESSRAAVVERNKQVWLVEQRALLSEIRSSGFDFKEKNWKTKLGRELNKSPKQVGIWLKAVAPEMLERL